MQTNAAEKGFGSFGDAGSLNAVSQFVMHGSLVEPDPGDPLGPRRGQKMAETNVSAVRPSISEHFAGQKNLRVESLLLRGGGDVTFQRKVIKQAASQF